MMNIERKLAKLRDRERKQAEKLEEKVRRDREDTQISDRSLAEYCACFGLEPTELKGKKILDIGSGKTERFSKEAAKYGAGIVSLTPELRKWWKRRRLKGWLLPDKQWQRKSVAARAQGLPFASDTFDIGIAFQSVPKYLPKREDKKELLTEMLRVIKESGKLYVAPVFEPRGEEEYYSDEEVITVTFGAEALEWLKENQDKFKPAVKLNYLVIEKLVDKSNGN